MFVPQEYGDMFLAIFCFIMLPQAMTSYGFPKWVYGKKILQVSAVRGISKSDCQYWQIMAWYRSWKFPNQKSVV